MNHWTVCFNYFFTLHKRSFYCYAQCLFYLLVELKVQQILYLLETLILTARRTVSHVVIEKYQPQYTRYCQLPADRLARTKQIIFFIEFHHFKKVAPLIQCVLLRRSQKILTLYCMNIGSMPNSFNLQTFKGPLSPRMAKKLTTVM